LQFDAETETDAGQHGDCVSFSDFKWTF